MTKPTKKLAHTMYQNPVDSQQTELPFENFTTPFGQKLNANNKWVKLSEQIPWASFEAQYANLFSTGKGAPAIPFRTALGALIVKEKLGLSDRDTVEEITENPYIQYFIGLPKFQLDAPFDASMMTHFRKRIDLALIKNLSEEIVGSVQSETIEDIPPKQEAPNHQGKLLLDATCTPSDIRYPTDLSLLNEAREKTEKIIDVLWNGFASEDGELKPRTYRRRARKDFLLVSKMKKCSASKIRKSIRKQLEYIKRNLATIKDLKARVSLTELSKRDYRNLLVVSELYRQQREMYRHHTRSTANRIVSISQPHVRPIIRGKAASPVEFGAKISVADVDGFVYLDRLEWEAYHEGADLILQAEAYRSRFGFWPESIHADKAYTNRTNRTWCKERGIRLSGPKLGRPPKETEENKAELREQRKQDRQDEVDRIEIEGKFGIAKRRYGLGRIMAKLKGTSETMIGLTMLVMNLDKILRDLFVLIWNLILHRKWMRENEELVME